jgi:2-aminoethylphosphonate transport system permease protein
MLVWSSAGRLGARALLLVCFGLVYAVPMGLMLLASVAGEWNDVLPSKLTLAHYGHAFAGEAVEQLRVSIATGAVASLVALLLGTWAALSLRGITRNWRRLLDMVFFVPSAVPSVSVGLGLLVAFSRKPFLLNGTIWIVIIAHLVLISAFTFGNVSAGLARMAPDIETVAESLGATPFYRLRRITLPLLTPYLIGAFSLSFALSMGELGATVMVYPPGWVTLPVGIFALTDRGAVFDAAALTIVLAAVTLAVLFILSRLPNRASGR